MYGRAMVDDVRLETKLTALARDLTLRPILPGFQAAEAFTMRGTDETGKPGMFAAVLLAPSPTPELETLTTIRQLLAKRLKQLDTTIPAWPIVVQGAPELVNGQPVVPGGRAHFEELKRSLELRRLRARPTLQLETSAAVAAPAKSSKKKAVVAARAPARAVRVKKPAVQARRRTK